MFGLLFAAIVSHHRHNVQQNLRAIRGGTGPLTDLRQVALTFANFASSLTDALALASGDRFQPSVECLGEAHLRNALAVGRGVIVATAHTAGWEIALASLRKDFDRPVMVIMQAERDPKAREVQDEVRRSHGVQIAYVTDDPTSAIPLVSHLRSGGVVAVQLDRPARGVRSVGTRLFDRDHPMPIGPFALASITGAPVITALAERLEFMSYRVTVGPHFCLPRHASAQQIEWAALRVARQIEDFVGRHPTQWFHFVGDLPPPSRT